MKNKWKNSLSNFITQNRITQYENLVLSHQCDCHQRTIIVVCKPPKLQNVYDKDNKITLQNGYDKDNKITLSSNLDLTESQKNQ